MCRKRVLDPILISLNQTLTEFVMMLVTNGTVIANAFTVTGVISPVIVNVYTNGSVYSMGATDRTPDHIYYFQECVYLGKQRRP